jgi:hypothetical protein
VAAGNQPADVAQEGQVLRSRLAETDARINPYRCHFSCDHGSATQPRPSASQRPPRSRWADCVPHLSACPPVADHRFATASQGAIAPDQALPDQLISIRLVLPHSGKLTAPESALGTPYRGSPGGPPPAQNNDRDPALPDSRTARLGDGKYPGLWGMTGPRPGRPQSGARGTIRVSPNPGATIDEAGLRGQAKHRRGQHDGRAELVPRRSR